MVRDIAYECACVLVGVNVTWWVRLFVCVPLTLPEAESRVQTSANPLLPGCS